MRSMLSNNGQPDDRSELIVQNNTSKLLLATGWNLDDDGHHDTAMQNRWSALNGPINWRKQTKKTKHNPQKFSHQCTSKPAWRCVCHVQWRNWIGPLRCEPLAPAPIWAAQTHRIRETESRQELSDRCLRAFQWQNVQLAGLKSLFFKQKHGTLSLHRPTSSMVMANCGRPQDPNALECFVAASARRPMIYTLSAVQPACVWLLKTNQLCRRSVPLFLLLSDVLKDTQKLLPSVRDTWTLPFVGSVEGTMAAWCRINQKNKEPESNGILRKMSHTPPTVSKRCLNIQKMTQQIRSKALAKNGTSWEDRKHNREIHWSEHKTEHNQIARTGKPNVPLIKKNFQDNTKRNLSFCSANGADAKYVREIENNHRCRNPIVRRLYLSKMVFSVKTRHLKEMKSHCHFCPVLRESPHKLFNHLRVTAIGIGMSRTQPAQTNSSVNAIVAHHQRTWWRFEIAACQSGAHAL